MNHEKLDCYQRLIQWIKEVQKEMPTFPRGYSELSDQLKRALISSVCNLVEGNGRTHTKERKRFFNISTSSMTEVAGLLDLVCVFNLKPQTKITEWKEELRAIYKMVRSLP